MNFNALKSTFQDSIFTWDYFTDFEKVKKNIQKIEKELNLLNYLLGKENLDEEFLLLIEEYPKVRNILPILIAIRDDKLSSTPIIAEIETLIPENKKYIFYDPINDNIKKELLLFFKKSGLRDIFKQKAIKNLVDYCFGVEVGMDTNGRKNRTGDLMENVVGKYLETFCQENKTFSFVSQATKDKIKKSFNRDIELDKNSRRFDFALFNKNKNKLFLIEVNYYSSGGSKLKATAGEYQYLNDFLKMQDLSFIWITDGKGWLTALRPLEEAFNHNDHVINLKMLKNGILEEILNS